MSRRASAAFLVVFAASLAFVYGPLLGREAVFDDVGLFYHLWVGRGLAWSESFGLVLARCAEPVFFRPLLAPVFWLAYRLVGDDPFYYRLAMLAAVGLSSVLVGRVALRLGGGAAASRLAALLYAFSWVQWSSLVFVAGLGQSLSDVLFWAALLLYLRPENPRPGLALAVATAALLLKEHAVVWPLFAWAALDAPARARAKRARHGWYAAAWAAGYLLLRAAWTGRDFLSGAYVPRFDPAVALAGAASVLASLAASWAALPATAPGVFELFVAAALGAAAAACLRVGAGSEKARAGVAARFLLTGLVAGLLPYAAFPDALTPESVSRFTLSWGACAAAFGAWGGRAAVRAPAAAVLAAGALLFARAATALRRPDTARPEFRLADAQDEARWTRAAFVPLAAAAKEGDLVVLAGFDPVFRAARRLRMDAARPILTLEAEEAAPPAGRTWRVTRREGPGGPCLDVRPPDGPAVTECRQGR